MISSTQCRGARAMLGWSIAELAKTAQVGLVTVSRFERGAGSAHVATATVIQHALEAAGVEFLADNGVRLATGPSPNWANRYQNRSS